MGSAASKRVMESKAHGTGMKERKGTSALAWSLGMAHAPFPLHSCKSGLSFVDIISNGLLFGGSGASPIIVYKILISNM